MNDKTLNLCILDAATTNPGDLDWSALKCLGHLTVHDRTSRAELPARAAGQHILITNKVVLDADTVARLDVCRLVCLMSTGTNAVDLKACRARGIPVCNIPAYSTAGVAEMVFSLLLNWARGAGEHAQAVREGAWSRQPDFCFTLRPQAELNGRCLGLLGFGLIAQAVARIARAFDMQVIAHTPHPEGKPDLGQRFVDLDTLLAESDVLSLHCPLNPDTEGFICADTLARMKPGAVLINTGRGGLLAEADVAAALSSGRLGAALLDVLSTEPPPPDHPLIHAPNCWITPHIAWAGQPSRARLIEILAGNVRAFLEGQPRHVVNAG
jgi:glycerate dehydrogenase